MRERDGRPALRASLVAVVLATAGYLVAARNGLPPASGLVGHGLGVVGFLMMLVAQLGYSWRKRMSRGSGAMEGWLRAHVFAGLVGPYLVLLHGAFAFRGLAGVTLLLTAVLVATGLVGRYLVTRLPRPATASGPEGSDSGDTSNRADGGSFRRGLAPWWLLHVAAGIVVTVLGLVHAVAVLYYAANLS